MENKAKYLVAILFMLVAFLLLGATNTNASSVTVTTEEELRNAVKGSDSNSTEVKLGNDITLTKYLDFSVLGDTTFDLAGYTLNTGECSLIFRYASSQDGSYHNFNSKLTIKDSSSSTTGKIMTSRTIELVFWDYELKNELKNFGLTIDGGTFIFKSIDTYDAIFSLFDTPNCYANNTTTNFIIKKGNFEITRNPIDPIERPYYLFSTPSKNTSMIVNCTFESFMLKGANTAFCSGGHLLHETKISDVIPDTTKIYYTKSDGTEVEFTDRTKFIWNIMSGTSDTTAQYIKLVRRNGFEVSNVELKETYGYATATSKSISIKNVGKSGLKITNVTSNSENFIITGTGTPTVDTDKTNTDFTIKAKEGLNAGKYTGTITVTAEDGKTYIGSATLVVSPKALTGVGIGLPSSWTYGTVGITPSLIGVDDLSSTDYEVTYAKKGTEEWSTKQPTIAGNYVVKLHIKNSNYSASDIEVDFKIIPNSTEIRIIPNSHSWNYDGKEHTDSTYIIYYGDGKSPITNGKLPNGDKITTVIKGSVKDVVDTTSHNNKIESYNITNSESVDVKDSYSNIKIETGTLTIKPISTPIVVTAGSSSKNYDKTALTNSTYTSNARGILLTGDELSATITGSQAYVGTSYNTVTDVKVMRDGKNITSNYTFGTHIKGSLEVKAVDQNLWISDQYVNVNGEITLDTLRQKVTGSKGDLTFDVTSATGSPITYDGLNQKYVVGSTTGTIGMEVKAGEFDVNGDGIPEYKETKKRFTIYVVEKETVTITGLTNSQEFTYDGTAKKPAGTISVTDNKVPVEELEAKYTGTGSTTYNSTTAPTNVGTYMVTYKVKDSNANYIGSASYSFTIKKAQLEKVTLVKSSYEYTGNVIITDQNNYDENLHNVSGKRLETNVGNYTITVSLKDKDNYEWTDGTTTDLVLNWSITQATPEYTVPTNLNSVKGHVLADITLPTGFSWNAPATVLTAGTSKYKATFTPTDVTNYKIVTDIDVTVVVKDLFNVMTSVNGENGTITPSKIGAVEGSKVKITFTPDTGYMIDKVLVNGTEKSVTGNEIELIVNEEKNVVVSYKKIPFTVTIEDVEGATVNPNGVVTVNYGDNKDFTITANSGYKLVKILVNNVEKKLDVNTLKLINITTNMNIKIVVKQIVYEVTEGANQKYTIAENTEVRFKINADYSLFNSKVYIDNTLVDSDNYISESGSTIITFPKTYVETLAVGEHTLKVTFMDGGEATTKFEIAKKIEENNDNDNNNNDNTNTPSKPENKDRKDSSSNPKTADDVMLYVAIASMSILGLGATTIVVKKKKTN